MSVDRIILESLGVLLVGGGAFLLSNVFALAPLAPNLSKKQSTLYFVAIPVAVYAAFRLYFGALFYATKTLSVSRPRIGEGPKHQGPVCPHRRPHRLAPPPPRPRPHPFYAVRTLTLVALVGGVYALFRAVPNSEEALRQLYAEVVGDLVDVVWKAGEGQVKNARKLGGRIFGLLCGWFLLLFTFELLVRAFLFVLSLVVGGVASSSSTAKAKEEAAAVPADDDPAAADDDADEE
jgi:hypothetical protein